MKKVIVIGDGIVGLLSALTSAKYNHDVTLINIGKQANKESKIERYFSINLLSKHVLMSHGVWEFIDEKCINPFNKIIAWDSFSGSEVTFNSQSISFDYLGYIIKESEIKKILLKEINQNKYISYFKNVKSIDIKNEAGNPYVISDNHKIYFDILVAADGKSSDVVNILNVNNNFVSYDQNAIVMNVQIKDNITRNTSYQRFNRGDVQGLLPINGNTYNLIWSTDKENSEKLIKSKKSNLLRILNNDLSNNIGHITSISSISKFPLSHSYLESNTKDKIIFIGDAAHTIHPLAGLGLNMGIQDVFFLDLAFEKYFSFSNTIDSSFLNYYKILSGQQNKKIMNTVNFLKKFYEENFIPSIVKKSLVKIFDDNSFLKSEIIREATGVSTLKNLSTRDYYQPHY